MSPPQNPSTNSGREELTLNKLCTPFELLVIARQIDPSLPPSALKSAEEQLRMAEHYLRDPFFFASPRERLEAAVASIRHITLHIPMNGEKSQDEFIKFASGLGLRIKAKPNTLQGWLLEYWQILEEAYQGSRGPSGEYIKVRPVTGEPVKLPDVEARWFAMYCKFHQRRSREHAKQCLFNTVQKERTETARANALAQGLDPEPPVTVAKRSKKITKSQKGA